jgi:hypothetical protein
MNSFDDDLLAGLDESFFSEAPIANGMCCSACADLSEARNFFMHIVSHADFSSNHRIFACYGSREHLQSS